MDNMGYQQVLNPDNNFENFVIGSDNRLAFSSCKTVSESPGKTYNPLFIYGATGLGKTHLLNAICLETKRNFPKLNIEFLSCEEFINGFIRSIETGDLSSFQRQFRSLDMMVIDDVQFLREREQSQEEFFHTFNVLYNNGKQIIMSADSPPGKISSIEERLISRFNWGLVARIDPPSYETRFAIVQKKAQLRGINISVEVSRYIARIALESISELEGALTTVYAMGKSLDKPITVELASQALEGKIKLNSKDLTIDEIIEAVTNHFGVKLSDLQSKKRRQEVTLPRYICMYLARNLTNYSLEEIGGHMGGRNHTSVKRACDKIHRAYLSDQKINALINDLAEQIRGFPLDSKPYQKKVSRLRIRALLSEFVQEDVVSDELVNLYRALNAYHIECGGNGLVIDDWETFVQEHSLVEVF